MDHQTRSEWGKHDGLPAMHSMTRNISIFRETYPVAPNKLTQDISMCCCKSLTVVILSGCELLPHSALGML